MRRPPPSRNRPSRRPIAPLAPRARRAGADVVIHRNEHRRETLRRVTEFLRIADAHAVSLTPLDRLRDRHAADRRGDHRLNVGDVHAVPRRRRAIDVDVQVVPAHRALGERAARSWNRLHGLLDLPADPLQLRRGRAQRS